MKVLHILNSIMPSGAETMLVSSAGYWKECEKHVLVTQKELGSYAPVMEEAGYHIHHIWDKSLWKKHWRIKNFIKKWKFDVVHIHPQSQSVFYAVDAWIAKTYSLVRTVHNNFEFDGVLRIREVFFRMLMRWMGVRFVAISEGVAENEKVRFKNNTVTIYNWCNPEYKFVSEEIKAEKRRLKNISDDTFVFISVGNCSDVKNHKMILEAIRMLDSVGEYSFLYIHVGVGDSEEKNLAYDMGIYQFIDFVGNGDPGEYLPISDCYIMPSKYEGMGIAALEAITCGLPVILTDVPGLRDFKDKEFDNVYFISDTAESLKEMILELIERRPQNSLHQSCRAKSIYNVEDSVEKYIRLYKKINV